MITDAERLVETENLDLLKETLDIIDDANKELSDYSDKMSNISKDMCIEGTEGTREMLSTLNSNIRDIKYLINEKCKEIDANGELSRFIKKYSLDEA